MRRHGTGAGRAGNERPTPPSDTGRSSGYGATALTDPVTTDPDRPPSARPMTGGWDAPAVPTGRDGSPETALPGARRWAPGERLRAAAPDPDADPAGNGAPAGEPPAAGAPAGEPPAHGVEDTGPSGDRVAAEAPDTAPEATSVPDGHAPAADGPDRSAPDAAGRDVTSPQTPDGGTDPAEDRDAGPRDRDAGPADGDGPDAAAVAPAGGEPTDGAAGDPAGHAVADPTDDAAGDRPMPAGPPPRAIGRAAAVERAPLPATEPDAAADSPLAGRYRLRDLVGTGGMGRVWLARDEMLDRDVAVKEIVLPAWMDPGERAELYQRTLREARAVARLNNPYVMQIFDVVYREDRPWIVMEYVPARSLYQVIQQDGRIEPQEAARIGLAVLNALDAAHRAGVLHRDVKPGNVLVADDGRVVLTDFGLATFLDGGAAMTTPGLVLGSPQYIAPERAREGISTPETDLWSLGATLYAAVEGRSPFARSTAMVTLAALASQPPDPAPHAGSLSPVLDGLLCKDPAERMDRAEARRLLTLLVTGNKVPRPRQTPSVGWRRALPPARPAPGDPAVPAHKPPSGRVAPASAPRSLRAGVDPPGDARPLMLGDLGGAPHGRRTGWIIVLTILGVLAAVAVLTAVVRGGRQPAASSSGRPTAAPTGTRPPVVAAPSPVSPCAAPAAPNAAAPVEAIKPRHEPYALPRGWRWYHDQSGFQVAVRRDWQADVQGGAVCFHDGQRTLGVQRLSRNVDPVAHIKANEKYVKAHGLPRDYRLVRVERSPDLPAATWEYRYTGPDGKPMHAQRTTIQASSGHTYDIYWQTDEPDWQLDQDLVNLSLPSFSG